MGKSYYVYILTNKTNSVFYTGLTSDLDKRTTEHKLSLVSGFTSKYHVHKLVYYEIYDTPSEAIQREKQLKKWLRRWKIELIENSNPNWKDLYDNDLRREY